MCCIGTRRRRRLRRGAIRTGHTIPYSQNQSSPQRRRYAHCLLNQLWAKTDKEQGRAWMHLNEHSRSLDHEPPVPRWDIIPDSVHVCLCGSKTVFCPNCDGGISSPLPPLSWTRTSVDVGSVSSVKRGGRWPSKPETTFEEPLAARAVSVWSVESDFETSSSLSLDDCGVSTTRVRRRLASRSMCSLRPRLKKSMTSMRRQMHMRNRSL